MRALRAATLGCLIWAGTLVPAQADSVAEIRSELNALSAVVADLARELSSGAAASQPGFDGALIDRVEQIRTELARLTGRTEELEFRIRRVIDEASNRLGDLEFRLTELEGGDTSALTQRPLGGEAPRAPAPSAAADGPELAAGENVAFEGARSLAQAGDHDAAAQALQEFLDLYPGSPLGAEASLLLGEAHRARGAEPEAARAYLNLYLADPDGPSAPRALLALGDSLGRLGQREEACVMFDELRNRFGTSTEAQEAEAMRPALSCP
ncbi:MAG: tetratricopeptide repeat protein [Natronohydrobacter sp.]|nr:tetratricopeptide repeat protein [Natronohydrobacter sp.]